MESPSSIFLGVGSFAKQGAMSAFSVNRLMDLIFVQAKVSYFTSYHTSGIFYPELTLNSGQCELEILCTNVFGIPIYHKTFIELLLDE